MADGDVFTRRVPWRWRSLAEALRDGLPASDCGVRLERALAKELRESGGLQSHRMRDLLGDRTWHTEDDVVRALQRLSLQQCFDRVVPMLVGRASQFRDAQQARDFVALCFEGAQMRALARSLDRHPDGHRLRAPSRRRDKVLDILEQSAPLGRNA